MEQHRPAGNAVHPVADDPAPERFARVHADLVGAPGFGPEFDQALIADGAQPAPMGARGLGAAIVGDPVYSRAEDDDEPGPMTLPDSGMLLHASRLVMPRKPHEPIDVSAPLPERFGRWLDHI